MRIVDIFSFLLKGIKSSDKPGQGDKEPDIPNKYRIKEIPGKVLI